MPFFFQVKVIGPGSVPTKETKDARAVENPGTVTATRAKAMVVAMVVESVPWLAIISLSRWKTLETETVQRPIAQLPCCAPPRHAETI